jgi:hypothetical protein
MSGPFSKELSLAEFAHFSEMTLEQWGLDGFSGQAVIVFRDGCAVAIDAQGNTVFHSAAGSKKMKQAVLRAFFAVGA